MVVGSGGRAQREFQEKGTVYKKTVSLQNTEQVLAYNRDPSEINMQRVSESSKRGPW